MIATICSSEKRPFRIAPSESGASLSTYRWSENPGAGHVLALTKDKPLKNETTKNGAKASNSKMASRSSKCRLTTSPSHPVTQSTVTL
jgi:hypothetical protein